MSAETFVIESTESTVVDAFSIVQRLAEWSEKYPRQQIHSFSAKIDEQLIEIEDSAKAWLAKFRTSQQ